MRIGKRRSGEIVKADYVQPATGARLDDKGFILHIFVEEGIISKEISGVVELRERTTIVGPKTTRSSMSMLRFCAIGTAALAGFLIVARPIEAQEPPIQQGRTFAQANCARCHAIGRSGESPLPKAPPFRTLHERYPVEDLEESLAEGIRTGHSAMPEFALDENQIHDLISYLKSLER